jgi:hypothetical protein
MNLPELSTDDLARLRLQECQGTLIGGMKVACSLGISAEQFGFRMMMEQGINWTRVCGDLDRIARIFYEHYQVTYGFGAALRVSVDADSVRFDMPALESGAAGARPPGAMRPAGRPEHKPRQWGGFVVSKRQAARCCEPLHITP